MTNWLSANWSPKYGFNLTEILEFWSFLNNHSFCFCFFTFCPQEGLLYWCDARTDKIERINLETGKNRELVLGNNNMDMFAVSVFEEYIYWSDRSVFTLF